jgi:uncharacterized membrane protein
MRKTLGIWKTTVLGGLFFLLPFAVLIFLIGQVAAMIVPVAAQIEKYLPEHLGVGNVSLATVLAVALVLALCYLSGLVARRSFASRFSGRIEKYLLMLFPRYAIIKDQMASNIGGDASRPQLTPVMVTLGEITRLAFEVERTADGAVTVYFPGSPDPWQGHIAQVSSEHVTRLNAGFGQVVGVCETLGRGAARVAATSGEKIHTAVSMP